MRPDRERTRAAAVGSQRLTAWAMARPMHKIICKLLPLSEQIQTLQQVNLQSYIRRINVAYIYLYTSIKNLSQKCNNINNLLDYEWMQYESQFYELYLEICIMQCFSHLVLVWTCSLSQQYLFTASPSLSLSISLFDAWTLAHFKMLNHKFSQLTK
jgi:hypothetical protein